MAMAVCGEVLSLHFQTYAAHFPIPPPSHPPSLPLSLLSPVLPPFYWTLPLSPSLFYFSTSPSLSFILFSLPPFLPPSPPPAPSPSLPPSLPVKPDLPENYESETWKKLGEVVLAIQTQCSISYSLEELYQAVENMCSHKMAAKLYSNLRVECERHVQSLVPCFQQYPSCHVLFLSTCTCVY